MGAPYGSAARSVGNAAIEALAVQPGERVLDIGCGCGQTTLQVAGLVAPTGSVVGLDISEPMVRRATARAAVAQLSQASFVTADAQTALQAQIGGLVDVVVLADPDRTVSLWRRVAGRTSRWCRVCAPCNCSAPMTFPPQSKDRYASVRPGAC